jgi:NADH-quinone oxidoreductase subunit J
MLQVIVFLIAAAIVLTGAGGVVFARHPVHAALFLIQTLFGVAVLFLVIEAHFLAAIQVIVYAGAIVILFLFVIMLLGVDRSENLRVEPIVGQRQLAWFTGASILGLLLSVIYSVDSATGQQSARAALDRVGPDGEVLPDVNQLAESIFTDFVFAFEVTGLLLTVAVVGAVVMARKVAGELQPLPELPERRLSRAANAADPTDDDAETEEN